MVYGVPARCTLRSRETDAEEAGESQLRENNSCGSHRWLGGKNGSVKWMLWLMIKCYHLVTAIQLLAHNIRQKPYNTLYLITSESLVKCLCHSSCNWAISSNEPEFQSWCHQLEFDLLGTYSSLLQNECLWGLLYHLSTWTMVAEAAFWGGYLPCQEMIVFWNTQDHLR